MSKYLLTTLSLFLGFSMLAKGQSISVDKQFENITNVEINVVFSDVHIEAGDGNTVHITGSIQAERNVEDYEITTKKQGTTLYLEVEHPRRTKGKVKGHFHLIMPSMTDVVINSVSGKQVVSGIGQRMVSCNTVSGNITANKIGSKLSINTVSGDYSVDGVRGDVKTNSVSGDGRLSNIDGNLKGNSVSGDFTISHLKGTREITTLAGNVN
ncbi:MULTISPECIES: hypothetical protein [unclassified Carboxylicivirga]|uniref:hypothetical protein n=1 Tax=Carboxylicivirga TaxID=1628153 RepID=UPI003D3564A5